MVLCLLLSVLFFPEKGLGTYAVITIDVCWACGDDFQATWEGKEYGVPLIVRKLEAHGFRGTFFVSPYCPPQLRDKMFSNLNFLISRGHDIELHTHTEVLDPLRPNLSQFTQSEKRQILTMGIKTLQEAGAPAPVAHRAGRLSIDEETLKLLPELGIFIDSSIYPRWPDSQVSLPDDFINRFVKIGGAYQLPIFLIRTLPFVGEIGTTAFQLGSTIWLQQKAALEQVAERKLPLVTIFLHFFDFFDNPKIDKPFEPLRPSGPNYENIDAFDNILTMLENDTRFKVVTVRELWDIHAKDPNSLDGPSFVPYPGLLPTYLKCWKFFFSNSPLCKIVVVTPLVLSGFIALLAVLLATKVRRRMRK
jgi:peptidoglycan/xylan/chitin deacetylase (PgdA/CDA1 family)